MIFGATGDQFVAARKEDFSHDFGVIQHLFLIFGEGGVQRLQERDGFRGDDLHQRPALNAGEDGGVELFLNRFVGARENQPAARPAQGFVGGGGDDIGNRHRVWRESGRDQSGDVRHIDQQIRADAVGNVAEAL